MKHLNVQKTEAEALRADLSTAARAAMQADTDASSHLEACLTEERQQAATDRDTLLSQITGLINRAGEDQEARLEGKINSIRSDIFASRTGFESSEKSYQDGMDIWSKKEHSLIEEVMKSRDTLKGKMKKDWTVCSPFWFRCSYILTSCFRRSASTTTPSKRQRNQCTKKLFVS